MPDENGRRDPNDRVPATVNLSVGEETSQITLENTVKSEITNAYADFFALDAGEYTVRLTHHDGTYVLDSLLVRRLDDSADQEQDFGMAVLPDAGRTDAQNTYFLAVAPEDGYYDLVTEPNTLLDIDGAPAQSNDRGSAKVYLRRGLNYIGVHAAAAQLQFTVTTAIEPVNIVLSPQDAQLDGTAQVQTNTAAGLDYISGISGSSGFAQFTFTAPESGIYKMTVQYSANHEQGVHDYNVDLVEDYITVSLNGRETELYCRNTCSKDQFTTVTVNVELKAGTNTLLLYNDGSNAFNGTETYAPDISGITINRTQA